MMSANTRKILSGIAIVAFSGSLVGQFLSRIPEFVSVVFAFTGVFCLLIAARPGKASDPPNSLRTRRKERNRIIVLYAALFFGTIAGYFIIRRDMPQLGIAAAASSAIFALILGSVAIWLAQRFRRNSEIFKKKRAWLIALAVVIFPVAILFNYLDRYGDACRRIDYEIGLANAELNRSSAGLTGVQNYVRRLKAIDTRRAPPDVQQTFKDYIVTFERALTEFQVTRKSGIADQQVAAKQKNFR